jgi:hypothetical protein
MKVMKHRTLLLVYLALILVVAACGKPQSYGDAIDTSKIGDVKPTCRLGECKSPEPSPESTNKAAVGSETSAPAPQAEASKAPETKFFDVYLVAESPFYAHGQNKELGQALTMPTGFTLRVTNDDRTEGRPVRSFTAEGAFDSGRLRPGQTWSMAFGQRGKWDITDVAAGFIRATFEVV